MSITEGALFQHAPALSYGRLGKRLFDLVAASLLLVLALPLIVVLALVLRCQGGPAFFVHERVGRGGQRFGCIKLRTMLPRSDALLAAHLRQNPDAAHEWQEGRKLRCDPRVTRFGSLLRRTSLDELPQLWNVIRGEMSLVGPRPVTAEELDRYGNDLSSYLALRPGITGLWQVEARTSGCYVQRVACDRDYARALDFGGDVKILGRTALVLFAKTGS
ncbi:exopolysaccharide production protein ExoY [Roseivivax lentus]|uniref:Exopolysaccharide production protein ExoY n=1 Tax=Roseivivax lentus TaxID=633194 RepID=A0A1N7P6Q8_9RHOB|nr:sugar transferase [Roseivivax lentus]SIT06240.1 exopolysaccharide production protein ExoY [Roseivivax lentus]